MAQDKFMFFENFKETADKLPPEMRLKFYDAITDYVFYEKESDDPVISALVSAFKPSLNKVDRRGGKREGAGAPKGNKNATKNNKLNIDNQKQSKTITLSETETETETETEEYTPHPPFRSTQPRFYSPTLDEVLNYARQQNDMAGCGGFACSKATAEEFWGNYEANGWVVGNESRTPVRDWKAKLRQWCARERKRSL